MNEEQQNRNAENPDRAARIAYLISGYIGSTLTASEHDELDAWVLESDANMKLFEELTDESKLDTLKEWMSKADSEKALARFNKRTAALPKKKSPVIKAAWALAAAASIFWLFMILNKPSIPKTGNAPVISDLKQDVAPGSSQALLVLSNGRRMVLDSVQNGELAAEERTLIDKQSGAISYAGNALARDSSVRFNELIVPLGGEYRLTLSDGTQVWLNAGSSLRYPVAFSGNERKVEMTGEAYFEVAKNTRMPFRVSAGGMTVEVLGTHFNVNAYTDEKIIATTLLEGSVKISSSSQEVILKPGEQSQVGGNGLIRTIGHIDTNEVVAWKNGLFSFRDTPIESLMRQASRWYNVEVKYEGNVTDHFNATINRNVPMSKLLHLLELTGRVHFEIQGKTVIVKS